MRSHLSPVTLAFFFSCVFLAPLAKCQVVSQFERAGMCDLLIDKAGVYHAVFQESPDIAAIAYMPLRQVAVTYGLGLLPVGGNLPRAQVNPDIFAAKDRRDDSANATPRERVDNQPARRAKPTIAKLG